MLWAWPHPVVPSSPSPSSRPCRKCVSLVVFERFAESYDFDASSLRLANLSSRLVLGQRGLTVRAGSGDVGFTAALVVACFAGGGVIMGLRG